MQIKLIFTRKVVPLASFLKWGFLELGSVWFDEVLILFDGFFFFYDLCFWSDCPPSWIIMSSVINWGSPPHKGRKLRWGSVADPGEGYPPPPYLRVWITAHTTPPPPLPLPPLSQGLDPALRLNAGELRILQNDSSLKLQESLSLISFFLCVVKRTTKLFN